MKVIIAGGRNYHDASEVARAVALSGFKVSEVVSGGASGVDAVGEAWASERGVQLRRFPADWSTHGRAAGPIRNRQMAAYADALVAVWDGQSRGTANMIREAEQAGLSVYVHRV